MGPTASGKTDLAMAIRQHLPVELISVDSAMVYRGMDIGTAKPSAAEQDLHPHRMIDICDPAEPFSVADFVRQAHLHVEEITGLGRIPLLVGGTMLYFRSLLDGLAEIPVISPEIRKSIEKRGKEEGWPSLHAALKRADPETAATIHPNHSRRIQRALEVYEATGRTISDYRKAQPLQGGEYPSLKERYRVVQIALLPENRQKLHESIASRFQAMLEAGFQDEVRQLFNRGDLNVDMPSIRAVGYQQMWRYLSGDFEYGDMVEKGVAATRQLAKRQFTWLRKWDELYTLSVDKGAESVKIMQQLVNRTLKILSSEQIY